MATAYIVGSAQAGSAAAEKLHENASRAAATSRQSENTRHNPPSASTVAYLSGKRKYGSSSAWYDSAAQTAKDKQSFVDKLKQQITDKQNNLGARYHLTDKQAADGKTINRPWMSESWSRDDGKTIEDLQKELAAAERQLANAEVDLKYATEWRHYDADMDWLDTVKNSGQDWGFVSDNLNVMAENTKAAYDKAYEAYTTAIKQNEALDNRRGRVPSEVGYQYTSAEGLARLEAEMIQTRELRDMASRRYGYSLDELAKDSEAVKRGEQKAGEIATRDETAYSAHIQNLISGMENGGGYINGVDIYKGYTRDSRPTDTWNKEQLNRYYVILDRNGEEAAAKYAVNVNSYNNAQAVQGVRDNAYAWGAGGETGIGRGALVTVGKVLGSVEGLVSFTDKARRVAATGVYAGDAQPGLHDYLDAAAQGRADRLNELGTAAGKGLGDIYQLTNSMAQSLALGNAVGAGATLAVYFGQAADQGFDDAMSRDATPEQALMFGALSGAAEAAAEIIPLENLLNADKSLSRGFIKSALIQAGLEGLEEGETDLMTTLADQIVMADKSTINLAIQQRMEQGESYEEAARAEWNNFVKNVAWDVVGGAISGAGSSAVQHGIVMGSKYKADDKGNYLYGADAKTLGAEAAAVTDNKALADLGKKVEAKAEKGGTIRNYTAKKLAEGTNRVSIVNATEQQVKERVEGLSDKDARALANAIVSESRGEKNGPGNQKLIEKHRDIADTLLKELGKDGEVAAWAREIGVRGMEAIKYGDRDINNMRQKLEEAKENIEADAEGVAEADMSASITIGDVSGVVQGMSIGNGKPQLILKNSKGTEQRVDVDEAIESGELPAGMARLAYESLGLGNAAADVYRLYKPGQNVTEYVAAMDEAISIAADVSKREAFDKSETVQELTAEQKDFAWSFGQQQRTEKQESRKANKDTKRKPARAGTVSFDGVTINGTTYKATTKDKIKAADLRVIERIAKAANVNVVFYESDSIDGMYQGANGFYRNGTVYLDVHAAASKTTQQDAILLTAAHELTHHIRLNAEAQYDALKEFVVEHLLEQGMDFETMVQDKLKEKGMKRADAVEEVVADACEMVLKDSKAVEKLAKENKSLAQTIADWLHGFYEDIKAAFEGVEARSKEAKAMTDYMDELVKLWDDALIEASKGESKQSGKVKRSIRADFYTEFDAWDKKDTNVIFTIGTTSEALKSVNIKNQEIKLSSGTVLNKIKKHGKEGVDFDTFRGIPELLEHPVLIQFSDAIDAKTQKHKYDDSITVIGDLYANGKPVMVALNLQPTNQKKTAVLDVIFIKSAYTKNALQNYINENTILYIDPNKKRTNTWLSLNRLQLPLGENQYGSIRRISYDKNGVKVQNSKNKTPMQIALEKAGAVDEYGNATKSIKDSEGNALSKGQQEYFKDSKARDAEGNLLVMYHQTANDFTVFDPRRNGAGSSDTETPYGIFLKSSPDDIGLKGKKQMMLYANITNPLVASNREELREKLFELSGEYRKLYEEAERIDEEYHQKYLQLDEETIAAIRKWRQGNPEGTRREAFESPEVKRLRERIRKLLDEEWPAANRDIEAKAKEAINLALESNEYDGVILQNDVGSFGRTTDAYIALRPEQVKNVDNSAPTTNPDIRHSRRDTSEGLTKEEARAQAQAYTRLKAENAALQRRLEYWQGQTKRTKQRTISRGDVDKYAKQLIKMHGSTVDADWLKQKLREMGDYLVQNEDLDYKVLNQMAWEISRELVENAEAEDDSAAYDVSNDIINDFKGYTFHLNEMYKNDLPEGFRKQYRGKLKISFTEGRAVDSIYEELQESYGKALFPDMPTQADMLVIIGDVYDTVNAPPAVYNPYRSHMNEAITSVSYDILDMMMSEDIRQTAPTKADKADAKLQQQKAEDRRKLNQVRADKNARIAEIRREETAKRQEAVAKEKAAKHDKVKAVREYYQTMIKQQNETRKENAAAKKYRDRAREKVNDLITLLRKNSDKEHIPEALKAPLIDFLKTLDFSSKQLLEKGKATAKDMKYADALEALERIAAGQQNYFEGKDNKDMLDMFLDMGDLGDVIRDHRDSVKAILEGNTDVDTTGAIAYMNAAQLKDLSHILTVLTTSIRKLNKFHKDSHFASVVEAARAGMKAVDELGPEVEKILGADKAAQFLAWQNTIPYYAFKRFGEAGSERFEAFVMGWSKMAQNLAAIKKFAADTYTAEQVKEWESEIHEFNIRDIEFRMTTAQIMGLYCSEKREQAMNHLRKGGMRIGKIETKGKVLTKVIDQKQVINLTPSEILDVISTLTPEQVKVASELQKFMNTTCAAWGNEISMERFGYRQFTESNYYPIKVVDSNLDLKDTVAEETSLFRLLNMSMTKSLTPNANNSVVINSIFDVFATHTADMAKYNGLALPVLDMLKWYNYRDTTFSEVDGETHKQVKSMHKSIETAFGNAGTSYITNFMKDMNGAQSGGRDEGMLKGFMGRYKAAAVAFNARVVIQQPTSIVRAAYKINAKYLVQGATMSGGVEEAKNNSGLALWKSMGFFDTNVARGMTQQIKHAETAVDKIQDASMKAAEKADEITWGTIWNACKLEQMDKGLSGNALIEATTKRFNEIIVSTQVMDSTITRSDIMRNGSLMMKELTSFKAEPTVTYNMMLESMMELVLEYRRTKSWTEARKKAWPFMWRAGAAYAIGQIATAAAAAIVDALRDDDEYQDFIQKWLEHLEKNLKQGVNILNQLPIIGEAVNIALGKETHESMLFQPLTQLSKASTAAIDLWRVWFNSDKELNDPNRTNWGRLYQIGQAISSLSGIPVAGGMREFKALWNLSGGLITGKKLRTYDSGAKNQIKYALLDKYITETEAVNLLLEVGEYENADDAYWAVQEWANADNSEWTRYNDVYAAIKAKDKNAFTAAQEALGDHGIAPKSVRAEAKRYIGKQFIGEEGIPASMDEKTALAALQDFAGLAKIEAQHLIDEWKFEKQTGARWADLKAEYVAGTFDKKQVQGFLKNFGHEYSKDAAEKVLEWTCEKDTGVAFSDLCDAFIHGELTAEQTQKYLEKYGGETPGDAAAKVAQWSLAPEFGIKYSSTDAGIKKALIEGYISDETAKAIMVTYGGKSWEEAEDYVNQYHFTEETGYSWSEIEEAYADGVIDYEEMVEWFTIASLDTHGSEEVAREYAEVAQWKKDIEGAEKINRTALDKWNTKGDYMTRAGLDKVDFTDAWYLYSTSYSQYDAYGNKTKEKAQVFFEKLFALYQQGIYSEKEIDAIARTVYSKSYVNKYAMW